MCDTAIDELNIPSGISECNDVGCRDNIHLDDINKLCTELIDIVLEAGNDCFPKCAPVGKRLACWNSDVKPFRENALFWHSIWVDCGRPPAGSLAMVMRSTRARYHRAVRVLKRNQAELRKTKLAEKAATRETRDFWTEVKKINGNVPLLSIFSRFCSFMP